MSVKQITTGKFINGEEVFAIELINSKGTCVQLFNYGAILNKFLVKNAHGTMQDIVLGFDNFEDFLHPDYLKNYPFLGAAIGRYANRIKNGEITIDQKTYQLVKNSGEDTLHGGEVGFDRKVWDVVAIEEEGENSVTLSYQSVHGEEHFPGNLIVDLTFELTEHDELILSYEAETDLATAVNLTHHGYFNLAENGGSIAEHQQQIFANHYLAQDDNYVVTGELVSVECTPFDFRTPKTIGRDWDAKAGYDQTFVLDKTYGDLTLATQTTNTNSGLCLSVYTTEPVAHFYTAKYLSVKNGKNGQNYGPFEAFCVETQHHPNAINIPHFPSTVLKPNDLYTQTTIYKVSVVKSN